MVINFSNQHSDAEPYRTFNYAVEVDGTAIGGFTHVSGLNVEAEVMEYQEGGLHDATHKFPTDLSHSNVQLHRGITDHDDFIKWITQSTSTTRQKAQRDVVVTLNDIDGRTAWGWKLLRAFPVRWSGPEMGAQSSGRFAMELIELSCEELQLIK